MASSIAGDPRSKELYAKYREQMTKIRSERKERMAAHMDQRSKSIDEIKTRYTKRRQQLKLDPILSKAKKFEVRKALTIQMKHEIDRCFKEIQQEQRLVRENNVTKSWREWLRDQAKESNETALGILQQRSPLTEVKFGTSNNARENSEFLETLRSPMIHQSTEKSNLQPVKGPER